MYSFLVVLFINESVPAASIMYGNDFGRKLKEARERHLIVCLILCVLGSETYQEAIRDIKLLFPEGVCCPPSIDLKAEEVHFTLTYSV